MLVCHLPMARTTNRADGQPGKVFAHMPPRHDASGLDSLAHDGVSCTVCHQITSQKLGTAESYTGGYVIDTQAASARPIYGPFEIDKGRTTVMRSSSGFAQEQGRHIQQSQLRFQPIGYRWAKNLTQYDASETKRFVRYYDSLAPASSEVLSRSTALVASSNR